MASHGLIPGSLALTMASSPGVVTFEQFCFASDIRMAVKQKHITPLPVRRAMPSSVQVGTILMKEWPGMPPLAGFDRLGEWSMVKVPDAFTLDRKIHAAGWNFIFMAAEVKAMFFGPLRATKLQRALKRILAKVEQQHFNGLEVTAIVARHFLGVPYVTVSAHSRHMQRSCNLESAATRRSFQHDSEWARG
jgi:hypothetical protein